MSARPRQGGSRDAADERRVVRVYLGDHLAVMRGGGALARRMLAGGRHDRALLEAVAAELDSGRDTAAGLLRQLGASPPRLKLAAALVAERLGRAKLNGRVTSRSPLSDLLELEGLAGVVGASGALWRALEHAEIAAPGAVRAHGDECARLGAAIEEARLACAGRVLAIGTGPTPR